MFRTIWAKIRPVHIIMAAVFIVGMVVSGYKFLDAQQIGLLLVRMKGWMLLPLFLLPIAYLWLKATRFADLFGYSGVKFEDPEDRRLTKVSYASAQMATLLPGGYVARIGLMESSLGLGAKAVIPTLAEKFFDITLLMVVGLYACSSIPGTDKFAGSLLLILVLIALIATSSTIRRAMGDKVTSLLTKVGAGKFVKAALEGQNPGPWINLKIAVMTVLVLLVELAILWASFFALGLEVSPVALVLAYAVADVVGRIAPTPGGVGLTEMGMVALLAKVDGMDINHAAAATFLFRILLFLMPALYGSLSYLFIWSPMSACRKQKASTADQEHEHLAA